MASTHIEIFLELLTLRPGATNLQSLIIGRNFFHAIARGVVVQGRE
jgi:hypothetical protein